MTVFRTLVLTVSIAVFGVALVRPLHAQDAAEFLLRLDKLEAENRRLNGQIEQLQFQMRKQDEQFKRYQADADLRLKDVEGAKGGSRPPSPAGPGPQKRSEAGELYPSGGLPPLPNNGPSGNIASSTIGGNGAGNTGLAPGPRPLGAGTTTLSDKPLRPSTGSWSRSPIRQARSSMMTSSPRSMDAPA